MQHIMQTTIQAGKHVLSVSLHPATVIHANKYSETSGGWSSLPVQSKLYTDVVFRSKRSGRDWPIKVKELDLPIYTNQDVTVIAVEETIVGYIDTQNERYHYTDTDFALHFNLGMRGFIALPLAIAAFLLVFFLVPAPGRGFAFLPPVAIGGYYFINRWTWNRRVEKALDHFLSST